MFSDLERERDERSMSIWPMKKALVCLTRDDPASLKVSFQVKWSCIEEANCIKQTEKKNVIRRKSERKEMGVVKTRILLCSVTTKHFLYLIKFVFHSKGKRERERSEHFWISVLDVLLNYSLRNTPRQILICQWTVTQRRLSRSLHPLITLLQNFVRGRHQKTTSRSNRATTWRWANRTMPSYPYAIDAPRVSSSSLACFSSSSFQEPLW